MPSRRWHSAAAQSLIAATGLDDAREAMVRQVTSLLEEVGVDQAPVDLRVVGSFQRVKDIQSIEMPHAGRLILDNNHLVIQVNSGHSRGKQNFTVGHEIGHTLLPSYQRKPRLIEDLTTGTYDNGREEEYLCDVAAAEVLMPMSLFRPRAASAGFDLDAVADLARSFQASREATAIRLVDTGLWPCAFAMWHHAFKPTQRKLIGQPTLMGMEWAAPAMELRVRYAVHSSTFGHYLHPHLSAEADGRLMRCFTDGGVVIGEERVELRGRHVSFHVMAGAVDFVGQNGPTREVLSLLLAERPAAPAREDHPGLWSAGEQ